MNMAELRIIAVKTITEHMGIEPEKVTDDASFVDDLGADSLDTVELVMAFEEGFGIEIPDDDAEKVQTFGDMIRLVAKEAGVVAPAV